MHDESKSTGVRITGNVFNKIKNYLLKSKALYLLGALFAIILFFFIMTPNFITQTNLINVARQMSINMIIAVGMTFVIVSGGLDLSVGSVGIMSGCLVGVLMAGYQVPIALALLIGLSAGALCGFINGLVITRLKVPPFVATLGMSNIARGVAIVITGGYIIHGFPEMFNTIGIGFFLGIPFPVYYMAVIVFVGHMMMSKTEFGLNVYAIGGNEPAARLAGLRVDAMKLRIYVLSGFLAAFGGIVLTARVISAQPALMQTTSLEVIAAVFVGGSKMGGGSGTVMGTLLGATIMALLFNGMNLIGVGYEWQQVAIGIILILSVSLDKLKSGQQT